MVILSLLTSVVFAEQLVVIESESSLPEAKSIYSEDSTVLVWSTLQRYPLMFSNATQTGECSVYPKSINDVQSALANVQTALDYWELEKADGHLLRVEGNLRCLNEIVSDQLLSEVYFVSGLTYFQRQDETNAVAQWVQALTFDDQLKWDDAYEPSGKPLFEQTSYGLTFSAKTNLIPLPSTMSVTVDGSEANGTTTLYSGKHLVQYGDEIHSYLIDVEEAADVHVVGFSAFEDDLGSVMASELSRKEYLKALKYGTDFTEFVVMTDSESWTPIPGGTDWDKTNLELLKQQTLVEKTRRPSLMIASIGTVSLSALSFYFAAQKFDDYMNGVNNLDQIESANHLYFLTGIGLGVASGGLLVAGVTKW